MCRGLKMRVFPVLGLDDQAGDPQTIHHLEHRDRDSERGGQAEIVLCQNAGQNDVSDECTTLGYPLPRAQNDRSLDDLGAYGHIGEGTRAAETHTHADDATMPYPLGVVNRKERCRSRACVG